MQPSPLRRARVDKQEARYTNTFGSCSQRNRCNVQRTRAVIGYSRGGSANVRERFSARTRIYFRGRVHGMLANRDGIKSKYFTSQVFISPSLVPSWPLEHRLISFFSSKVSVYANCTILHESCSMYLSFVSRELETQLQRIFSQCVFILYNLVFENPTSQMRFSKLSRVAISKIRILRE